MISKKGSTVFLAISWNCFNVAVVKEVNVTSWGKKVGKGICVATGYMLNENLYLKNGDCDFAFSTYEDAEKYALVLIDRAMSNVKSHFVTDEKNMADNEKRGKTVLSYRSALIEVGIDVVS